jgi:hypothetical protein
MAPRIGSRVPGDWRGHVGAESTCLNPSSFMKGINIRCSSSGIFSSYAIWPMINFGGGMAVALFGDFWLLKVCRVTVKELRWFQNSESGVPSLTTRGDRKKCAAGMFARAPPFFPHFGEALGPPHWSWRTNCVGFPVYSRAPFLNCDIVERFSSAFARFMRYGPRNQPAGLSSRDHFL